VRLGHARVVSLRLHADGAHTKNRSTRFTTRGATGTSSGSRRRSR
jgi:hypothetical protein